MRAKLGNAFLLLSLLLVAAVASPAHAQKYDFATCDPAVTALTVCSSTVTACCTKATTASSSFLLSGTDKALIIPLDRCHQRPGTSKEGAPNDITGASPYWCYMATPTADDGMYQAYGLMYRLLQTQRLGSADAIPVYWVVNPAKDPPALTLAESAASQTYISTDIDFWVVSSAGVTPPALGTALTPIGTDTNPVKHVTLTSGNLTVDTTAAWNYNKKQFPVRGAAFVIAASDRAKFEKFIKRQAPYTSASMPFQARTGCNGGSTSCSNWSAIDMYEIQPTASIGWTDHTSGAFRANQLPIATTLNYSAARVARIDGGAVSTLWLKKAALNDISTASCKTGPMNPIDSVYCDVNTGDIAANVLINGNFSWLWLDSATTACSSAADISVWTNIRTFLTQQAGVRAAGNAMLIDKPIEVAEVCANKQLLGAEVTGRGLDASAAATANPVEKFIVRYPQSLFQQWGDLPMDFSSSSLKGFTYAGFGASGYNPLFSSGTNTLHRLVTMESATTTCTYHKGTTGLGNSGPTAACDQYGAGGDVQDVGVYGRFKNNGNNGIVFYLPGNQIANRSSQLRMVLNSLLATPLGIVPITTGTITEVSRNTPIAMLSGEVVQGTYEVVTPTPGVPTFSVDADATAFRFPYSKGHLRARTGIPTNGDFASGFIVWDAADPLTGIPNTTSSYSGCGAPFTAGCRTIFTTTDATRTTTGIALKQFNAANAGVIGPIMAPNLTAANQQLLMKRVIAGDDSATPGTFVPKLGGVDRSTVAIIEPSGFVNSTRPTIAYFGARDGMLHAVCATTGGNCLTRGQELWAYIPRKLLSAIRYNTGRIAGSPNVIDAFGDFYGTGTKSWRTILVFTTGSGNATAQDRIPATYAMDISDPFSPKVLWEQGIADVTALAAFEEGQALEVSQGRVRINQANVNLAFVHSNNLGTAGAGSVVTAIDVETGDVQWKRNGYAYPGPRTGGNNVVPTTGVPGGAVPIDQNGQGYVTDLVFATLYGDVWVVDPATGASRYQAASVDVPLFRFSTDFQPIGATPSIYSDGIQQMVIVASGGFADPSDTHWACNDSDITNCTTLHHIVRINLDPVATAFPINELATSDVLNKTLALNQRAFASPTVIGDALYVTVDSTNVNGATYGTSGTNTGQVLKLSLVTFATSSTTGNKSGAGSVTKSGASVFAGGQEVGAAPTGTTNAVDSLNTLKVTRQLWLRSE